MNINEINEANEINEVNEHRFTPYSRRNSYPHFSKAMAITTDGDGDNDCDGVDGTRTFFP